MAVPPLKYILPLLLLTTSCGFSDYSVLSSLDEDVEDGTGEFGGENGFFSQDSFLLRWEVGSTWTEGQCVNFSLENQGRDVSFWTLVIELDDEIVAWPSTSGAVIEPHGERIVVKSNDPLLFGEQAEFQYCAEPHLMPESIVELNYDGTLSTGSGEPGIVYSLSDYPLVLRYRENGSSLGGTCYDMEVINTSDDTIVAWEMDLDFSTSTNPTDWSGDFSPIAWNGDQMEIIPSSFAKEMDPLEIRSGTLCLSPSARVEDIDVQVAYGDGTTGGGGDDDDDDPIDGDGQLYSLKAPPLSLLFRQDGSSNGGTCYNMQVTNQSSDDLASWSFDLILSNVGKPTDYAGEIYPIYWVDNRVEMVPTAAAKTLGSYEQREGVLCLTTGSVPQGMESHYSLDDGSTGSGTDPGGSDGEDTSLYTLRDLPLNLIYRVNGTENGGTCIDMEVTNVGDVPLESWSLSLALSEAANPTSYSGEISPSYWEGDTLELTPVSYKQDLAVYEKASGRLCLSPKALPVEIEATVNEGEDSGNGSGSGSDSGSGSSDDLAPYGSLRDGNLYLQYREASSTTSATCYSLELINGGSDTVTAWAMDLEFGETVTPTDFYGDFFPLSWDGGIVNIVPKSASRSLEPLDSHTGTLCVTPASEPVDVDISAQYLIGGGSAPEAGGDGGTTPLEVLRDDPITLIYNIEGTSKGGTCVRMRAINTGSATISDFALSLTLSANAKPTDWSGDLMPTYWNGTRLEILPQSYRKSLEPNAAAEGLICLTPTALPETLDATVAYSGTVGTGSGSDGGDGGDGSGTTSTPLVDGPITLFYKDGGQSGTGASCLNLEVLNSGDQTINSFSVAVTFSTTVNPVDWYGDLRPLNWSQNTLTLVPPGYNTSLDPLDVAKGTLCLSPSASPRYMEATVTYGDTSAEPLISGPLTLLWSGGGETSSGSCLDLSVQNTGDEDLIDWSFVLEMDDDVLPTDWWGDLYPTDWSGAFITLKPVDYQPVLEAGSQAQMTLCTARPAYPEDLSARIDLAAPPGGGAPLKDGPYTLIYTLSGSSSGGTCLDVELLNTGTETLSNYIIDLTMSGDVNVTDHWGVTPIWSGDELLLYPPSWDRSLAPFASLQGTVCVSPVVLPRSMDVR